MISLTKFNVQSSELNRKGFTLLELLIVISIIAILSVALVMVLNPAEIMKKSRDSQRIADLNTMKTALGIYLSSTSTPSLTYNACATRSSTTTPGQLINSTSSTSGNWIDVDLSTLTGGAPISNLPLDPINSGNNAYLYKCDNTAKTFKITTVLESAAYTVDDNKGAKDGGVDATRYEVGTNLQLVN